VRIRALPFHRLAAGLLEHPPVEQRDETGFFGHVQELGGHEQAALRMLPAHQGLETFDAAVADRHHRLVVHAEFAALEG
jgi:hypothetical protein